MRTHRDTPEVASEILGLIVAAAGDPEAPVFLAPGTYRGHAVAVVFVKQDAAVGEGRVALAPLAVILTPSEAAHVTIEGLTKVGESGAPSGPSAPEDAAEGEAVKVLRDALPVLPGVLGERAARVLRGATAAPAAMSTGVYL